jgi:dihydroorotate dehydrogenase (fumarate)
MTATKADLTTTYLGFQLRNPLIASSCPLTGEADVLRRLEGIGAAAAVLPSLFEEQLRNMPAETRPEHAFSTDTFGQSLDYFRELGHYNRGPDRYLHQIKEAKKAVSFPIIASLNGTTEGQWLHYAKRIEEAGADALELNIYSVVPDPQVTAEQIESRYVELVAAVRDEISIPLAVKVSPFFTAFANVAHRLTAGGADGLVLFNRFLQPDINIDALKVSPHLVLSHSEEFRLPLRWVAILRGQIPGSLAATGGIHTAESAVKMLLAGADAVMITSALYRNGIEYLGTMLAELQNWLDASEFDSIEQLKGTMSQKNCPDPTVFERANYTKAVTSFANGSV